MRRVCCIFFLFVLLCLCIDGQTVLYPGDLVIVGIQTDNPDDFSFVLLTSVQKHTVIYFTDCGVRLDGTFRNGEGGLMFTAPDELTPGTLINLLRDSADFSRVSDQVLGSRGFNLSSSGDQVIAFQDSSIHPRYLYAFQTNSSRWQNDCSNTNVSCLPPGLIDGYSAIAAGRDTGASNYWHNAILDSSFSGVTRLQFHDIIRNRNNWKFSNSSLALPIQNFNLVPDSNRFVKLNLDSLRFIYLNDSLGFSIHETNIDKLNIWIKNLSLSDSIVLENNWSTSNKNFRAKLPSYLICDSFTIVLGDADFPGYFYRSKTIRIIDTIPLRYVDIRPAIINSGDSLVLVFNKAMLPLEDELVLKNQNNGKDSIIISYSSGEIIMLGDEIRLYLKNVKAGASYCIELQKDWMSDLKGNLFQGMIPSQYPVFQVAKIQLVDSLPPELIYVEPGENAQHFPNEKIRFEFNEPLYSPEGEITDPDVLEDIISVQDINNDEYYDFIIEFDSLYKSFTILPLGLEDGNAYYITLYGFSDSTGNECDEFIYTFKIDNNTRVKESVKSDDVPLLFPNPAKNYLQINFNGLKEFHTEVFDLSGKQWNVKQIEVSENKIMLDLATLPIGQYILRIIYGGQSQDARFIKN